MIRCLLFGISQTRYCGRRFSTMSWRGYDEVFDEFEVILPTDALKGAHSLELLGSQWGVDFGVRFDGREPFCAVVGFDVLGDILGKLADSG